jgi:copper chaperone CopZ
MKKTYVLEGLDCAHCAAKIETAVSKIEGVSAASVNFMTTKMVIEADSERMEAIEAAAIKTVRKLEPDVAVRRA